MLIAKQKRKDNIAEYILYLWQIEDLMRALKFDSDKVYSTLCAPLQVSDEKKQEVFFWYVGIINLLKEEQKEIVGHCNHSLHLIRELFDIHLYLLKKDKQYYDLYHQAKNDIESFRDKEQKSNTVNEIEICFDALYSKLLFAMKKEELSDSTEEAFGRIVRLIAYLSAKFKRFETGEEAFEDVQSVN